jgi:KipI family sensor histidine kinase inhibitor
MRPYGAQALLVEVADASFATDLAAWARASGIDAREIVPGACTVLFAGLADPGRTAAALAAWRPGRESVERAWVEIPVRYDGADLADVARRWGMTRSEAAGTHAGLDHVVAFTGFAPGFAYLTGLPPELRLPRLDTPRPRVPAGSVAVADGWTGVYPTTSPGGWRLLGHTDATLWDVGREPPALLPPGTRVRFVETT